MSDEEFDRFCDQRRAQAAQYSEPNRHAIVKLCRDSGIKIRADRMDAELDGMATGLSNCLLKDGTQTVTANIPFNGKRLTGVAPGARLYSAAVGFADQNRQPLQCLATQSLALQNAGFLRKAGISGTAHERFLWKLAKGVGGDEESQRNAFVWELHVLNDSHTYCQTFRLLFWQSAR